MTASRYFLVLSISSVFVAESSAQVFIAPPPVVVPGIGFGYHRRHWNVSGFLATGPAYGVWGPAYPFAPYGIVQNRVSVQFIAPTIVVSPSRAGTAAYDLRGVDLDVVPASAIWGGPPPRKAAAEPLAAPRQAPPL
jgi:hypothetical protein